MKLLNTILTATCLVIGVGAVAQDRPEVRSLDIYQGYEGNKTFALKQLINQSYPGNLNGYSIEAVTVVGAGNVSLRLKVGNVNSRPVQLASGFNGPDVVDIISPRAGVGESWQLIADSAQPYFIETIDVEVKRSGGGGGQPGLSGPVTHHLNQHVHKNNSAFLTVAPGMVQTIHFNWTDWGEEAHANVYLNGMQIASDVDVNSDGSGRTIQVNRMVQQPSTLQILVYGDDAHIHNVTINYQGGGQPSGNQHFDYNRKLRDGESAYFGLNAGNLSRLEISWTDDFASAEAHIRINGNRIATKDVASNGQIVVIPVNQWLSHGGTLEIEMDRDDAKLYWVKAIYN